MELNWLVYGECRGSLKSWHIADILLAGTPPTEYGVLSRTDGESATWEDLCSWAEERGLFRESVSWAQDDWPFTRFVLPE